jgi:pimeloyl-ACP methyl ester carboxylesterase
MGSRMQLDQLEVKHRFAQLNGIKYHYVERGTGPLVVLLHGFPETWWAWRYQIQALAEAGFRVVAVDQRGYGESDQRGPYGLDTLASDIRELIRALKVERAHVIGHGMGGAVAWHLAARRPECVDRLAVLNCPHPSVMAEAIQQRPAQLKGSWNLIFFQVPVLPEWLLGTDRSSLLSRLYESRTKDHSHFTPDELRPIVEAVQKPGAARAMLGWYRAAFQTFLMNRLKMPRYPVIETPTLILWSKSDVGLEQDLISGTERFASFLRVVSVEGAGHYVQAEQPAPVNDALIRFLRAPSEAVHRRPTPGLLEHSEINVVLADAGESKISVVKELRDLTGLELREIKELVESVPALLKVGATRDEAERFKDRLTAVGAVVELTATPLPTQGPTQ